MDELYQSQHVAKSCPKYEREIDGKSKSPFERDGDSDVGDIVMLMTLLW